MAKNLRKTNLAPTAMDQFEDLQGSHNTQGRNNELSRLDFDDDEDSMIIFSNDMEDDESDDDAHFRVIGIMA